MCEYTISLPLQPWWPNRTRMMKIFHQCPKNSSLTTSKTLMLKFPTNILWGHLILRHSVLDMNQTINILPKDVVMEVLESITHSQVNNHMLWIQIWRRQCQLPKLDGDHLKVWLSPKMLLSLWMLMVHFNIGIQLQVSYCTLFIQVQETSFLPVITIQMAHNFVLVVSHGQLLFMMNRQDNKLWI